MLDKFQEGLKIREEEYSPVLSYRTDGHLWYDPVPAYNQQWLPRDKRGNPIPEHRRVSFDPATAWTEDRWILCRRLSGDNLCRILFYKVCTFVWEHNDLHKDEVRERQEMLLQYVFRVDSVHSFKASLDDEVQVTSWDGKLFIWMTKDNIQKMFVETCMTGPLVAMFGREVQQYLLEHPDTDKIPAERMQFSVDSGRTSMGKKRVEQVYSQYVADDQDNDRMSQSSKRTRSPKRNPPWKQSSPAAHRDRDVDVRSQGSDRRGGDVRDDPDYYKLKEKLRKPAREEAQRLSYNPREGQPRGSMAKLEPRHYEHKSRDRNSRQDDDRKSNKSNKSRHDDHDYDRRSDRRD